MLEQFSLPHTAFISVGTDEYEAEALECGYANVYSVDASELVDYIELSNRVMFVIYAHKDCEVVAPIIHSYFSDKLRTPIVIVAEYNGDVLPGFSEYEFTKKDGMLIAIPKWWRFQ